MSQSLKFKILFECSKQKKLSKYVLPFWLANDCDTLPNEWGKFILRSALKTENEQSLNSGVGYSTKGIETDAQYLDAKEKLRQQPNLDFLLLQPYFDYDTHLTLFKTKDFVFIEAKSDDESKFYFFNDLSSTSLPYWGAELRIFLSLFNQLYQGEFILEVGVDSEKLKIFQVNELTQNDIKNALYEEVLSKALAGNRLINNDSFLQKMKLEYNAYKFRKREEFLDFSDTFNNWVYIFFYFKIFCTTQKLEFGEQSFQAFLSSSGESNTVSRNLKRHLEIGTMTNKASDWNVTSGFNASSEVFIGSGIVEGTVDKSVLVSENLTITEILEFQPKVILTTYNSLLSHPILFCAENEISFVGGLSNLAVSNIKEGDNFSIDFTLKQIIIESS
jgi:phosphohistidine swiveling domain-containing protein